MRKGDTAGSADHSSPQKKTGHRSSATWSKGADENTSQNGHTQLGECDAITKTQRLRKQKWSSPAEPPLDWTSYI